MAGRDVQRLFTNGWHMNRTQKRRLSKAKRRNALRATRKELGTLSINKLQKLAAEFNKRSYEEQARTPWRRADILLGESLHAR